MRPHNHVSYPIRCFSRPRPTTVEITQKTFQSRYLMRPGRRFNALAIGALAKAQSRYDVAIHGVVFLSNHLHILATFNDCRQMSLFMRYFSSFAAQEIQRLHSWQGKVFPSRYRHVELSEEPAAELSRLRYLLSNSCKEGLVDSPLDWPGVSSAESLVGGEPMKGLWIRRTEMRKALERGLSVTEDDFADHLQLRLEPLPSLGHLSQQAYRMVVVDLIRDIEEETAANHRARGTRPLGAGKVLDAHPHFQPEAPERSPRPWCHAASREARQSIRSAIVWIVSAYRQAAEKLRNGESNVKFPPNTFPPALPFVPRPFEGPILASGFVET